MVFHNFKILTLTRFEAIKLITMKLYQTLEKQIKKEPNFVSDNGRLKNGWS
jgi:hypothetical protein